MNYFWNTILIPVLLISFYSIGLFLFSFKPILFFSRFLSEQNDNIKLIFLWSFFLCSLQYLYIKNMKSTIRIMANINLLFQTKNSLMVLFCWNIGYIMNKNSLFMLAKQLRTHEVQVRRIITHICKSNSTRNLSSYFMI